MISWKSKLEIFLSCFTEHHKSRQRQQDFQKRRQLPSITRAFSPVYFCCDRISCLPDCSGKLRVFLLLHECILMLNFILNSICIYFEKNLSLSLCDFWIHTDLNWNWSFPSQILNAREWIITFYWLLDFHIRISETTFHNSIASKFLSD